ncbi:N-6 DNA methylase [Halapricum desulfuricans]|nr:N-6 DNA methylase [Halapricum desulfuricans]
MELIERQGYSRYNIFSDWIDLVLYSLQGNDKAYLEIVEKYDNNQPRGQRPIDLYSHAFGRLQRGIAALSLDLLGSVYEEFGMSSDSFGQYFTPHYLCDTKAAMIIDTDEQEEDTYTVADPASGSGRLLISVARTIPTEVDTMFYAQDKDLICAKMTALNMYLFGLDGYAVHGDSLKNEKNRVWQIDSTAFFGEIRELDDSEFSRTDSERITGNQIR